MKVLHFFLFLSTWNFFSQNLPFDPEVDKGQLFEYAQFTNAGENDYSINDVIENKYLKYDSILNENHSLGFTTDFYWVKFSLKNSSKEKQSYYLETARPVTDVVNLYQIDEDLIKVFNSGDQLLFEDRSQSQRQTVFKITIPKNDTQDFYLKIKSDGETVNVPLNLKRSEEFYESNSKQQLFFGLFYGILVFAGLMYLFFYTSLKERSFFYYGFYVLSIALMQAALDGFLYKYVFTGGGYFNSRLVLITALFSNYFLLKYCEHFLNIAQDLKMFKKFYNVAYGIIGVLFLAIFINKNTLALTYPISNLNGLFSLILILASLFTLRYKRFKVDIYFSIGIFFLVIGLLGFVMNNLSLLPNNFYTLNSAKFGSAFEVIFLSLSMTNLIRTLRLEKEKSQELALQKSEEVSELKSYFMSNLSHELRTPINAILGIVDDQLFKENFDSDQRESFNIIKNASFSLLSNVNDIIDFERIEKNELVLRPSEFNPLVLLNQISSNWELEAKNKGLNYTALIDDNTPKLVYGDAERFGQIINNILSNAVKFTHEGFINLKLKCLIKPDKICMFSFELLDTGIGMDENSKRNVFNSYSQMRLKHDRKFGGIGLGLSIVQNLITLFNGKLKIESKVNDGTKVCLDIPLKILEEPKKVNATDALKNLNFHILVVEDNKLNQMVMKKMLSSNINISFDVVSNGQEALDTLKLINYDIVLMDLQMPLMDGYEATMKIRNGEVGADKLNIPIIAITADATEKTRQRVFELGMNEYISKPVNKEDLFDKITVSYSLA
ncbi:hybrid sensor histidine kinase/response regulator [Patiriisocius marinistellae]|uniref:histidine kinase n=1 Tax=Patiriisocius marinistellae TaxID=2494560 RepID=A0A5J4G308_9FLAO|nr:hybrid sensor histidine kinase/response regulator [Patiriisocius marinistellae]GEQ87289.1 hybrid sensor histidine kinase/response regulator [Patiriisocius marinistellae]